MDNNLINIEPCSVKLESFEGPLDLLLHLIKKHEIDIYDIPIALISEQYNQYLELLKEINLEIVGDYLLMAAELCYIKSRMLIPKPLNEEEEDVEDPREELVRRLIEYQRYKDAAQQLFSLDILERDIYARKFEDTNVDLSKFEEPIKVDLWSLMSAFKTVLERREYIEDSNLVLEVEQITIEDRIEEILKRIEEYERVYFTTLFKDTDSKFVIIVTFLALLELINQQLVLAIQQVQNSEIQIIFRGAENIGEE